MTATRENPLTLRLRPGEAEECREAAARAGLTLNAWLCRAVRDTRQLEEALDLQRELEEKQAARRRAFDV